tara:strand:- start:14945 stop:15241 length:297 start_codon:yes stop_codon:yes gene_type:complete
VKSATTSKEAAKSVFVRSINGLATTLAAVITFLGVPPLYGKTVGWVQTYTAQNYGTGWEDVTALIWFAICGALIFFTARASVSTALMMGALAIATRFF